MVAVVLGESGGQVHLRHEQAAWVEVADIERNQIATVVILSNVVNRGGAAKSVHDAKADGILVEHRLQHASDGAFLGPNLTTYRLLIPEITAVGLCYAPGVVFRAIPGRG